MIDVESKKANYSRIYTIISILFVLGVIVPLLVACCYAVPSADDFYGANNARYYEIEGIPKLLTACKLTESIYMNSQGTFTGCFFYNLFSALIKVRIIPTRITLLAVTGLFLVAAYSCVYGFMRCLVERRHNFLINFVYGLVILIITIGHSVNEVFYWICGTFMYTVPLTFMFAGVAFTIQALKNGRRTGVFAACVLCFLSTGGTLQIAALTNTVMLGIAIWEYERKKGLKVFPIFLSSFIGAVINVVAPGNYVRQDGIGAELDVILAIQNSASAVMTGIKDLLRNSPLFLVIMVGILAGSMRIFMKTYEIIGVIIYVIFSLIIIDFPITFAYGSTYLEPRVLFVQNIAIVTAALTLSVSIGQISAHILRRISVDKRLLYRAVGVFTIIMTLVLMYTGNYHKNDIMPLAICINLANGNMKEFNDTNMEIFGLLENGAGKDIVIEYYPSDMGILQPIKLQTDAEHWINTGVARYYGCNMVVLKE